MKTQIAGSFSIFLVGSADCSSVRVSFALFHGWIVFRQKEFNMSWLTFPLMLNRRPLGDPRPDVSDLALAVVLLIVMLLQSFFNAWQDYSTGRVMASISGMLPSDVVVFRDGHTLTSVMLPLPSFHPAECGIFSFFSFFFSF